MVSVRTKAAMDDSQKAVAQKLLHLEGELAFITQPGRLPPRAAVVAGLRKDIASLRAELANPGSVQGLDLTIAASAATRRVEVTPPTAPPPVVQSAGSKASTREMKKASGARDALLAIEKRLGSQANAAPLSEKAKNALEMIEGNMSSIREASKDLSEIETLQVENALLRTRLEIVMERKRHLSQLVLALRRGLIGSEAGKKKAPSEEVGTKTNVTATGDAKKDEVVYTF